MKKIIVFSILVLCVQSKSNNLKEEKCAVLVQNYQLQNTEYSKRYWQSFSDAFIFKILLPHIRSKPTKKELETNPKKVELWQKDEANIRNIDGMLTLLLDSIEDSGCQPAGLNKAVTQ